MFRKPRRFKASLSQGQNCKAQIAVASHHAVFATWNAHAAVEAFDTHPVNDEQLNASRILYHLYDRSRWHQRAHPHPPTCHPVVFPVYPHGDAALKENSFKELAPGRGNVNGLCWVPGMWPRRCGNSDLAMARPLKTNTAMTAPRSIRAWRVGWMSERANLLSDKDDVRLVGLAVCARRGSAEARASRSCLRPLFEAQDVHPDFVATVSSKADCRVISKCRAALFTYDSGAISGFQEAHGAAGKRLNVAWVVEAASVVSPVSRTEFPRNCALRAYKLHAVSGVSHGCPQKRLNMCYDDVCGVCLSQVPDDEDEFFADLDIEAITASHQAQASGQQAVQQWHPPTLQASQPRLQQVPTALQATAAHAPVGPHRVGGLAEKGLHGSSAFGSGSVQDNGGKCFMTAQAECRSAAVTSAYAAPRLTGETVMQAGGSNTFLHGECFNGGESMQAESYGSGNGAREYTPVDRSMTLGRAGFKEPASQQQMQVAPMDPQRRAWLRQKNQEFFGISNFRCMSLLQTLLIQTELLHAALQSIQASCSATPIARARYAFEQGQSRSNNQFNTVWA
eukprot:359453-Chlamydomonas_euryale.AAC.1